MGQSPWYNQSKQSQSSASRGNVFTKKVTKKLYLRILVHYLDNPMKEQHEIINFLNEEVTLKNTQNLNNKLNRPVHD